MTPEEQFDQLAAQVRRMELTLVRVESRLGNIAASLPESGRRVKALDRRLTRLERYRWWLVGLGVGLLGTEPFVLQAVFRR